MVNYSIVMRSNPMDSDAAKKAYASAQYSEVMDINRFAEHIASHGCVYKRADIVAILTMAVDCMREQLVTRNFAASLFRNIKYFTLRKLYLCRKWMQKRLQKTTTTGITLPNFDFLA